MTTIPQPPHHRADVTIIGGGLGGLLLANALAYHDLSSVVVEAQSLEVQHHPKADGRTCAISAGSLDILDQYGLLNDLTPHAGYIFDIRVTDQSSLRHMHYDHRLVGDRPMGAIIENRHMMKLFLETLQASSLATIIPQTLPTSIAVTPFNTNTTLSNGTTITSPLVVVADGRHSKTRELLGIGAKTTSYHQTAIVVTIAHTNPHHGIALEHFLASGPFASLPMAGGYHSSLVWTERDTTAPYYLSLDDNAFLYEIKQRLGDFLGNISLASDRYHYPLALVVADRTIQDRIALVADAAQGIHPIAGQGFNLGIRDIHALTQAILYHCDLGLDIGTNLVLEDYRKRRQLDSNLMISATHLLNGLFCSSSPALRGIRQLGLGVLNHFPYVKKIFMRHAMGELIGS